MLTKNLQVILYQVSDSNHVFFCFLFCRYSHLLMHVSLHNSKKVSKHLPIRHMLRHMQGHVLWCVLSSPVPEHVLMNFPKPFPNNLTNHVTGTYLSMCRVMLQSPKAGFWNHHQERITDLIFLKKIYFEVNLQNENYNFFG